jgi:putative transposase
MPRAHRVFVPGQVWHITHRCHLRRFLLRVRHDRRVWLAWLLEARRRHGLCVLNYIVTCNHIHLLVRDRGAGEISRAMQLIAGRTAQACNERKGREGAFWQDRYHATAVDSDGHLLRCMTYIDLNMVRAGVVAHPGEWRESGFGEIQRLPQRYRIVDIATLCRLLECGSAQELRRRLALRAEQTLAEQDVRREPVWTESLAVGRPDYLLRIKQALGPRATGRALAEACGVGVLQEEAAPYSHDFGPQSAF